MLFNSLDYLRFFSLVLVGYGVFCAITRQRLRWLVLLLASYCFYAHLLAPHLLVILAAVTGIAYLFGRLLDPAIPTHRRQVWFVTGITLQIAILVGAKYIPFVLNTLNGIGRLLGINYQFPPFGLWSSIGVSYFVFQALSYQIDVYLEQLPPERHVGYLALYLSFFPRLLQGPIERADHLLPQLRAPYHFNLDTTLRGLLLFLLGLFQKTVIADRLAMIVNQGYQQLDAQYGFSLLFIVVLYSFQLYYDFAGYTDMAIGSALILNINLTPNFRNPYYAVSVADFWRRWHISLSTWLADYVFTPLQLHFRNLRQWGTILALVITFTLCGLWHGARWTFVLWGLCHGVYMSLALLTEPVRKRIVSLIGLDRIPFLHRCMQSVLTFLAVSLLWILFRAESLHDVGITLAHLLMTRTSSVNAIPISMHEMNIAILAIGLIEGVRVFQMFPAIRNRLTNSPLWLRLALYYSFLFVLLFLTLLAGKFRTAFVYFQF